MHSNSDYPVQNSFERKVSLTTSLIAVALSISTIYANVLGDDLLISRGSANNLWAYFQSKSIKQNLFESQLRILHLEVQKPNQDSVYLQEVFAQITEFEEEIQRYEEEKQQIKKDAKVYEDIYKRADKQGSILNYAEAIYEISIILSAISLLARSRLTWWISISFGTIATVITMYVYFLT